jgi:hypothetical protein
MLGAFKTTGHGYKTTKWSLASDGLVKHLDMSEKPVDHIGRYTVYRVDGPSQRAYNKADNNDFSDGTNHFASPLHVKEKDKIIVEVPDAGIKVHEVFEAEDMRHNHHGYDESHNHVAEPAERAFRRGDWVSLERYMTKSKMTLDVRADIIRLFDKENPGARKEAYSTTFSSNNTSIMKTSYVTHKKMASKSVAVKTRMTQQAKKHKQTYQQPQKLIAISAPSTAVESLVGQSLNSYNAPQQKKQTKMQTTQKVSLPKIAVPDVAMSIYNYNNQKPKVQKQNKQQQYIRIPNVDANMSLSLSPTFTPMTAPRAQTRKSSGRRVASTNNAINEFFRIPKQTKQSYSKPAKAPQKQSSKKKKKRPAYYGQGGDNPLG